MYRMCMRDETIQIQFYLDICSTWVWLHTVHAALPHRYMPSVKTKYSEITYTIGM